MFGTKSSQQSGSDRRERTVPSVLNGQSVLFYHYRSGSARGPNAKQTDGPQNLAAKKLEFHAQTRLTPPQIHSHSHATTAAALSAGKRG